MSPRGQQVRGLVPPLSQGVRPSWVTLGLGAHSAPAPPWECQSLRSAPALGVPLRLAPPGSSAVM